MEKKKGKQVKQDKSDKKKKSKAKAVKDTKPVAEAVELVAETYNEYYEDEYFNANQSKEISKTQFINREISWLMFNERVLEEAQDKLNPLMERLKFLAITASNLDEFFMVRVSSLMDLDYMGAKLVDAAGMTPREQLNKISEYVHGMSGRQISCLNRSLMPALARENIIFPDMDELSPEQNEFINRYFNTTIYPILTPMAVDQSRPLPLLNNKSLNLIIELENMEDESESLYALMQIPTVVSRIIELPQRQGDERRGFMFLEDIIRDNLDKLFLGYKIRGESLFRITRNSDLEYDEEDTEDLLNEIEKSIKSRKWGEPVRIEIEKSMARASREFLLEAFSLDENDAYEILGPLDLTVWFSFTAQPGYDHLKNIPITPQPVVEFINKNVFEAISEGDIIAHHPYESFDCVLNFIRGAAADPAVLAIKQTLYRVSGNSPVVNALIQAAENGKQVTVLVELKARFDEENNINWAKKLEKSGCHVVYGLVGLKTHCKICLVVRKEESGIVRYVHLGTGNYNDNTAKIYTDLSYFTCKETFGQDVSVLFNLLTGYSTNKSWNKINVAPVSLRDTFYKLIENETVNARNGRQAVIIAKMNSLVDTGIIQALYAAAEAGVKIKLLVRGICCLRVGASDSLYHENITVMSIVDRFLEHSRIYYFENNGNPKILLSSADWMGRNLDRRVEVAFPIETPELKERILEMLELSISDTVKLRVLQPDGTYDKVDRRGKDYIRSQEIFCEKAVERVDNFYRELNENEMFVSNAVSR